MGDPIAERYREAQTRPAAFQSLGHAIQQARKVVDVHMQGVSCRRVVNHPAQYLQDEKYAHLEPKEIDKLRKACDDKQHWLDDNASKAAKRTASQPPHVMTVQILAEVEVRWRFCDSCNQLQSFENICRPIVFKPKPKPPKVDVPPPASKADQAKAQQKNGTESTGQAGDAPMDVDQSDGVEQTD